MHLTYFIVYRVDTKSGKYIPLFILQQNAGPEKSGTGILHICSNEIYVVIIWHIKYKCQEFCCNLWGFLQYKIGAYMIIARIITKWKACL